MSEIILHHYDLSPYAEKIRLCFGLKNLEWKSVQAPMIPTCCRPCSEPAPGSRFWD